MQSNAAGSLGKVPAVTLGFWAIKIAATTLGETGGDALSMTLNLGYALSTVIFAVLFLGLVTSQIRATRFIPFLYWAVIVATTTVGTTMADFADRSLGIGYTGGSLVLFALLMISLAVWRVSLGTVSVESITTPKAEAFYWATILFSNTLGTALGDFLADDGGLGYVGGALVFGAALAVIAALYWFTQVSRTLLFWAAFILTRPLGATVGDFLDKPHEDGGLALGRFAASAVILVFIVICILVLPQRAGSHGGKAQPTAT
ncbi:MAG TPA: hypothetical protein VL899_01910 [Alphaproteobacteria bacterium]|nr:hypothetical protein [Alphaproteobacteria bacterium]